MYKNQIFKMGGVKSLLIDSWEKEREEEELRNEAVNSIEDAYSSYEGKTRI